MRWTKGRWRDLEVEKLRQIKRRKKLRKWRGEVDNESEIKKQKLKEGEREEHDETKKENKTQRKRPMEAENKYPIKLQIVRVWIPAERFKS